MTPEQFSALAQLLRLRPGPSAQAAHLHFVDGLRIADAARQAGCTANAASDCARRVRKGLALARQAVGAAKVGPPGG